MKTITLEAVISNIEPLTQWIDGILEENDCSFKAQTQIDIAVDELFSNIAYYAYAPGTGEATVSVDFDPDSRILEIEFRDSGIPYNPLEKQDPDITLSAEQRSIGGLGIFMVKKSMDDVLYRYENAQNILTIKKTI